MRPMLLNDGFYYPDYRNYLASIVALSLYSDEVAVQFSFGTNPRALGYWLEQLLSIKPLADTGACRFLLVTPNVHGVGHLGGMQSRLLKNLGEEGWRQLEGMIDGTESTLPERLKDRGDVVGGLSAIVAMCMIAASSWPGKIHLLARSEAESLLMHAAADLSPAVVGDGRRIAMNKLIGLRMPDYEASLSALIAVRNSESAFAEWRDALRRALNEIQTMPDGSSNWISEAREVVEDGLQPLRLRIEAATRRSPFLTAAKSGLSAVSYSALGAAAGAFVGDDFRSALAGAGVAKGGEIAESYIKEVRQRTEMRAVNDIAMLFSRPTA